MPKFVYAFTKMSDGQDVVAICPKDVWEQDNETHAELSHEEEVALNPFLSAVGLSDVEDGLYEWPSDKSMADIAVSLQGRPDIFEGSESLKKQLDGIDDEEDDASVTEAKVEVPEPAPTPQPAPPQPAAPVPTPRMDCMKIQIGNHVVEIPMDVNTAMMLAQVFQTYAQYQIITGGMPQATQQPVAQPTSQQPAPAPTPEKPKSVPTTPTADTFSLPNSMRGEIISVHGKAVVKIEQGGKLIAETKPCDTRDEAYDIASRFARMIPGMVKPEEIVRK
jgi:hypothetical protein